MLRKGYYINGSNQLVVTFVDEKSGRKQDIPVPGRFWIEDDNELIYIVEDSAYLSDPYYLPRKIVIKGEWTLSPDHRLGVRPHSSTAKDVMYLQGEFVEVSPASIGYALSESQPTYKMRALSLHGKWQSDEHNRLTFLVERRNSRYQTLTFEGAWQVDNNTLLYRVQQTALKRSRKEESVLRFKGYWRLDDKNRLSYVLNKENTSGFNFTVRLESPSLRGKDGEIKYRVGIGYRKHRKEKVVVLNGTWKFSPRVGLQFSLDYGEGNVHSLTFQTVVKQTKAQTLMLGLKTLQGRDLGITIAFNRSFFQEKAQWFLRWIDQEGGRRLEGGITIPW